MADGNFANGGIGIESGINGIGKGDKEAFIAFVKVIVENRNTNSCERAIGRNS
jgi:hypothetical protein